MGIYRQSSDLGITGVQRSILCDPYAVAMRTGARLTGAEFAPLSRRSPTGRTSDAEYLFWAEFFCHTNLHVQKGRQLDKFREGSTPS